MDGSQDVIREPVLCAYFLISMISLPYIERPEGLNGSTRSCRGTFGTVHNMSD